MKMTNNDKHDTKVLSFLVQCGKHNIRELSPLILFICYCKYNSHNDKNMYNKYDYYYYYLSGYPIYVHFRSMVLEENVHSAHWETGST